MPTIDPIKVQGLREFQAALKQMDGNSQKMLRQALNYAVEGIASGARRKMPSVSGKAKSSVRAASSQREAIVKAGGSKAKYVPWLEFGGKVGKKRSVSRPWRPSGRYIYPTYSDQRAAVMKQIEEGLTAVAREAGFEVQ
jgi:phage gpG-like protein